MDNEIIYSIIGIITLILVIIATLKGDKNQSIKTKEQKRAEILTEYRDILQKAIDPLKNDKKAILAKKTSLLKKFSDELSRNIFFDKDEIRSIILELSK